MEAADADPGAERRHRQPDRETGTFPGGSARLPRLSTPRTTTSEPEVMFVESAFLHNGGDDQTGNNSAFERYYSAESLFESTPGSLFAPIDPADGPFTVLGVTASSSWKEISRAHRALVSELHPDRYVDADPVVRAAAERRVRDVNEAYSEIRRRRSVGGGG